jgi:hypothetical protein
MIKNLNYVSPYTEPSTSKFQNVDTYFSHKTARNEKTMKTNKETKHYITSKLDYLTTTNVLGLKYSRKCKGNVTYPSIVDYHCEQWVFMSSCVVIFYHLLLPQHTMVKIKKNKVTYAHQDHTQRNPELKVHTSDTYCTMGSTIFTGVSYCLPLESLQLTLS